MRQCKRRRTTASTAPSSSSNIDEEVPSTVGTDDAASEDASLLVDTALSVYSQVNIFDMAPESAHMSSNLTDAAAEDSGLEYEPQVGPNNH